jgi:hypothetical protein
VNHGAPPIAATARPGLFRGPGLAPGTSAGPPQIPYRPGNNHGPQTPGAIAPTVRYGAPPTPQPASPPAFHPAQAAPQTQYRPGNNGAPPEPGYLKNPGDYQGGRPGAFAPTVHYGIPPASQSATTPPPSFQRDVRPGPMMGPPPQVGLRAPAVQMAPRAVTPPPPVVRPAAPPPPAAHPQPPKDDHHPDHP